MDLGKKAYCTKENCCDRRHVAHYNITHCQANKYYFAMHPFFVGGRQDQKTTNYYFIFNGSGILIYMCKSLS